MSSRTIAALIGACALALAGEAYIYHAAHPNYPAKTFDSAAVSLDLPATWEMPTWRLEKSGWIGDVFLHPVDEKTRKDAKGFDTRWDQVPELHMLIIFETPKAFDSSDPVEMLRQKYEKARKATIHGGHFKAAPTIETIKLAGLDAWRTQVPFPVEPLDIGVPKGPGLFKSLYNAFAGGEPDWVYIIVPLKGKICEIRYVLPGDKISRARYQRVWDRILDSLKIKDA